MNKGFTLIELLAVLVILTALFLLTSTLVGPVLDNSKESLSEVQIKKIEEAAKTYYLKEEEIGKYDDLNETKTCINVSDLINNGYIDKDKIIDPESEKKITGSVKITYRANNYSYEYQEEECGICKLIEGSGSSIGDKLECEVKPGTKYNFYVLSRNEDNTLNLIMDRNIYYDETNDVGGLATKQNPGYVQWISEKDYGCGTKYCQLNDKGPITAMKYVYNATKDWINISSQVFKYTDENISVSTGTKGITGYGGIESDSLIIRLTDKNGNETKISGSLKARLPYYSELKVVGCKHYQVDDNYMDSCPLWLSNYLDLNYKNSYIKTDERNSISNIRGYWLLSSDAEKSNKSWYLGITGSISTDTNNIEDSISGVRPVITINKNDIEKPTNVICKSVKETTVGNVPKGDLLPGDKYECEVKPGTTYNFYVLSTEDDKVNLIMDRNICEDGSPATKDSTCLFSWNQIGNNLSGPVTSMNYLHIATSTWSNIPNIIINYEDENIYLKTLEKGNHGYGKIETENNITKITNKDGEVTATYTNLKARLPRFDEVHGEGKCLTYDENGKKNGSCPLWLVNYLLKSTYYDIEEGKEEIADIYGYSTLSSSACANNYVWVVNNLGRVMDTEQSTNTLGNYGIRPVISLYKFQLG